MSEQNVEVVCRPNPSCTKLPAFSWSAHTSDSRYQTKLAQRPVLTQAIMSAVLFGTGDVLAQQTVERRGIRGHSLARTARMAMYGGCIFGPVATKWYQFLANKIHLRTHNTTILARVAADQSVFATINLAVFLSTMSVLEGTDPKEKLRKSYLPGLKVNWILWPPVQAINFKLVRFFIRHPRPIGFSCGCRRSLWNTVSWLSTSSVWGGIAS